MFDIFLKVNFTREILFFSIDSNANNSLLGNRAENILKLSLPGADGRRKNLKFGSIFKQQNFILNLLYRLPLNRSAAAVAMLYADSSIE